VETTVGRLIFNEVLPEGLAFQNDPMTKSRLKKVMAEVFVKFGKEATAILSDDVKELGFRYATLSGISIGMDDLVVPRDRDEIIGEGEKKVVGYAAQYQQGLITDDERYHKTIDAWKEAGEQVETSLTDTLGQSESTLTMDIESGARATMAQVNQMAGMLGLMLNPGGRTIELPIRSNYKDGLSVLEYFISTHGARKGLTDTALRTAESGYLTRRLVDVSQDIIIAQDDCRDKEGYVVNRAEAEAAGEEGLSAWIVGRCSAEKIVDPKSKQVILKKNELILDKAAQAIDAAGIDAVRIRSILKCKSMWGICAKCYGLDLGTGEPVRFGEAIGIIAAQSIGEPGTQLTMRTMHAGGIATEDITQGLPRVEEIFEARNPKGQAVLADIPGTVQVKRVGGKQVLSIVPDDQKKTEYKLGAMKPTVKTGDMVERSQVLAEGKDGKRTVKAGGSGEVKVTRDKIILTHMGAGVKEYTVGEYVGLEIKSGDRVEVGQRLTEGPINLQDMLKLRGEEAVERYVIDEVQAIYLSQGQSIAAKHIEVIIRQMFSRVRVEEPGDTDFISGDIVSRSTLLENNMAMVEKGKKPATFEQLLMPITKISTGADSWLSAASFQETTRVLINAAMRGKSDNLRGLKENVIIGRLIPVGTGFRPEEEQK
jgi:DNA-directed RNA polymerase subunit beta'